MDGNRRIRLIRQAEKKLKKQAKHYPAFPRSNPTQNTFLPLEQADPEPTVDPTSFEAAPDFIALNFEEDPTPVSPKTHKRKWDDVDQSPKRRTVDLDVLTPLAEPPWASERRRYSSNPVSM
jgi:hypothetical protein